MAAVTVTTGVHFTRGETPELDVTPMGDGRWMVGVSEDCTVFGSAVQLRAVAQQILDQIPDAGAVPTCTAPVDGTHLASSCDCATVTAGQGVAR